MSEEYNFQIPTQEELDEKALDSIVKEFSADAPQEQETEETLPFRHEKKPISAWKVILTICAVLVLTAAIVVGIFYAGWRQRYQAAQPDQKSVEVFSLLFKDPDWALLYTMAGMEDTVFEDRDTFVRYMEQVVDGGELSYLQLPQQDPLTCRYAVFQKGVTIGAFTMTGTQDSIPEWDLGTVELYCTRSHSVTIQKTPDATAYVNGVALDSSYTIRSTTTAAEDFLPDGVHGYRMEQQRVEGLLLPPEVTVVDAGGNPVPMVYDSDTQTYSPMTEAAPEITDTHLQFALDAAKAHAAFAVRANSAAELRQFFDPNSNAYAAVCDAAPLLSSCTEYKFDPSATQVTNYRSYGDSLFSATVSLKLDVTLQSGDAHSFDLSWNYLYRQNYTGSFLIVELSDVSFHTLREQVRLTFIHDGELLDSKMLDIDRTTVKFPRIPTPDGMEFSGWAQKITDSEGNETMGILFAPSGSGIVFLPAGSTLEPMTLYAIFEKAG